MSIQTIKVARQQTIYEILTKTLRSLFKSLHIGGGLSVLFCVSLTSLLACSGSVCSSWQQPTIKVGQLTITAT